MAEIEVRIQAEDFDASVETSKVTRDGENVGALATFTGLCRSEDGSLSALELEHYPGMAERAISAVAENAASRWPVGHLTVIHRYGKIAVGEQIVLVLATSRHRDAAFDAVRFVMDFLKTDAPFWKKEHRSDGREGAWVEATSKDEKARERWESSNATRANS